MLPKNGPPTHPGEMLLEEFLKPRGMTPDTALRLSKLLGTTADFWLNGQRNWDLWHALRSGTAGDLRRTKALAG